MSGSGERTVTRDPVARDPVGRDSAERGSVEALLERYIDHQVRHGVGPDLDELCRDRPDLRGTLGDLVRTYDRLGQALAPPESLEPGSCLLHYRIIEKLGEGGMGEVYAAEDQKLGRRVALKLLRPELAADRERLRRFRREARAVAAFNHPNIVTLYSVEEADDLHLLTMELVEGTTLDRHIGEDGMPLAELLDLAIPIAEALAAAHRRGIVHRDLKPRNVMVTAAREVKVLDFGLAKLAPGAISADTSQSGTDPLTHKGDILGTFRYMSPEQIRGEPADARSDLFSFGVLLYEMATGQRPFRGKTLAEQITAIQRDTPPPVTELNGELPPRLGRIIEHCLEKDPQRRWQSAHDLATELREIRREVVPRPATAAAPAPAEPAAVEAARRRWPWTVAALLLLAVLAAAFLAGRATSVRQEVRYEQVSFGRGLVETARFAPDGESILFNAAWDNQPARVFLKHPEGLEPSLLGPEGAVLLSVSRSGELAILVGPWDSYHVQWSPPAATLARLPIDGSVPREVLRDVAAADWAPDGSELAVVRTVGPRSRLEYPPGHVLFETPGWLSSPRFSPDGELIAVLENPSHHTPTGWVTVIDRAGTSRRLSPGDAASLGGLAWRPDGREVWYSSFSRLKAVSLSGDGRVIARLPGTVLLGDISPDGRVLLWQGDGQSRMAVIEPGLENPRDLTWLGMSWAMDLSADGRKLLFAEVISGDDGYPRGVILALRGVDGSPVQRLTESWAGALSPDGHWIAVPEESGLSLVPVEAGQARQLEAGPVGYPSAVAWLPAGDRVVFAGREPGRGQRLYLQDVSGGPPQAVSREQAHLGLFLAPSPDGTVVAAQGSGGQTFLFPLSGEEERPFPGLGDGDIPIRWTEDGRGFLFYRPALSRYEVYRLDVVSGERQWIRTLTPAEPAGVWANGGVLATADGERFVFTYSHSLGQLYVVRGLI